MRGLFEVGARRAQCFQRLRERGIEVGGLGEPRLCFRDDVERSALGAVQHLFRFVRGGGKFRRIGEHDAFLLQVPILAGKEFGLLQFGHAEAREIQQVGAFTLAPYQIIEARFAT